MLREKSSELRKYLRISKERVSSLLHSNKRIGYIGGQGNFNLGDDAMYIAAEHLLHDAHLYPYDHPKRENRLAHIGLSDTKYFSAVILGGGTLITPTGCGNWLEKAEYALNRHVPVWAIGTGVGGCGFAQADAKMSENVVPTLSQFKGLGVRGPRSRRKLQELGLQNVEVVGDLALGLARDSLYPLSDIPSVAINLALPHGESVDAYPVLSEVFKFLAMLDRKGWKIVPIATEWSDKYPLGDLAKRLGKADWNLELIHTPDEFFDLVAPCHFSISVRLHAAVLSNCVGVPTLKVAYRDKCWDFMESMEFADWCVSLEGVPSVFSQKAEWFINHARDHRQIVLDQAIHWKSVLKKFAVEVEMESIS